MTIPVHDAVAEKLEHAGLWRRAAERWFSLMTRHDLNDAQREWLCQRRRHCRAQVRDKLTVLSASGTDFSSVARAANATLARMELSRPGGMAYRNYPLQKKARVSLSTRTGSQVYLSSDDDAGGGEVDWYVINAPEAYD